MSTARGAGHERGQVDDYGRDEDLRHQVAAGELTDGDAGRPRGQSQPEPVQHRERRDQPQVVAEEVGTEQQQQPVAGQQQVPGQLGIAGQLRAHRPDPEPAASGDQRQGPLRDRGGDQRPGGQRQLEPA
jgi:hypothetical protein